jgi:hypothetical protein
MMNVLLLFAVVVHVRDTWITVTRNDTWYTYTENK